METHGERHQTDKTVRSQRYSTRPLFRPQHPHDNQQSKTKEGKTARGWYLARRGPRHLRHPQTFVWREPAATTSESHAVFLGAADVGSERLRLCSNTHIFAVSSSGRQNDHLIPWRTSTHLLPARLPITCWSTWQTSQMTLMRKRYCLQTESSMTCGRMKVKKQSGSSESAAENSNNGEVPRRKDTPPALIQHHSQNSGICSMLPHMVRALRRLSGGRHARQHAWPWHCISQDRGRSKWQQLFHRKKSNK